ncbi:cupin domain-containing protein [Enterovibrio norvegicus]|uniref:Transcriptional regulator, contains XRE-family HTH domain n=1 Tax=Enterovibrio norvegicus DSM 15893 TaxID=1121869 RepID=A0A1I5RI20_9GAMM|nr:cupin domain-containing protein [Enterovibrio norvegicus]MCC4798028.1 cupin domain-containing protein [Enterovibrio norvegicus]OEE51603.1 XRE family transcriptional regulator [Enterovibrio norvegicus]OEF51447.1 XRE family transcriptional regulator [Enterovibrio norvegicus]PMH72633.1 XRE family transcriptional regulator [Enterovibrio norvegicus]PMI30162.1 XRE family transcriptional regulator [Enterovibrio norvegicus]
MDIGANLKAIRKSRGLSQRELAKRAGVTNSTISMIEKNSVSPSVSSLKKVLSGIPMSLVEFFSADIAEADTAPVVYRQEDLLEIGSDDVSMKVVGKAFPNRALSVLSEIYPPNTNSGDDMLQHDGEESGIVIEGRLELTVGDDVFVLEAGDSYYFDSNRPHRFANPFEETCRIFSATTPANF